MPGVNVNEAIERIKAAAALSGERKRLLAKAGGRVLARSVVARRDQPPALVAAMDGYAIATEASPLRLIGESRAGHRFERAISGDQTVRVFTGALVPAGTIGVVLQENVTTDKDRVTVNARSAKPHLRAAAQDFAKDEAVLAPGIRLDTAHLALAAAAGAASVWVRRKPRVAIVVSGAELVRPGEPARLDQVYEAASGALAYLIVQTGGKVMSLTAADDSPASVAEAITKADAQLVVTIGGASVGDYDCVRPALRTLDFAPIVDGVAIRPGRPALFGRLPDGRCVLALPGNPSTALIVAELLLKPYLAACLGMTPPAPLVLPCATALVANPGDNDLFLRARLIREPGAATTVDPLPDQDASLIKSLAGCDGLLRRPAGVAACEAGTYVSFLPFGRL